jgi:hypothetical protein
MTNRFSARRIDFVLLRQESIGAIDSPKVKTRAGRNRAPAGKGSSGIKRMAISVEIIEDKIPNAG